MFHHQTKHLAWACSWLLELPSLRSRPQELGYFWNRIFFLRQSTFRPHEISESVLLSRRFYNNGNSHKIKRFNTSPLLVSLLFSFLCYSQSHPKFLPVLPVKTGLRAYALSRHMSRHTLNSHDFSLRHTETALFYNRSPEWSGSRQNESWNKLRGFKSVWCKQGLTGHRICLGGPVVVTLSPVPLSVFGTYERRISFISGRYS